jgi:hypothetical protein
MILDETKLKEITRAHINFLELSYLKTLNNIETLLEELDKEDSSTGKFDIARVSIYKKFYDDVIVKNLKLISDDAETLEVVSNYRALLETINYLMLRRKSSLHDKQVNIFTTNIDIFFEKSFESSGLEYNDGFNGRFKPEFNLSNFKKSIFKKSLQYDNISEIPTFNLVKLHGSLSWKISGDQVISFTDRLEEVGDIDKIKLDAKSLVGFNEKTEYSELISESAKIKTPPAGSSDFKRAYEQLGIVNPDKNKFKHSILNENYYELLRIYTNELEKESALLFVFGFSFADEHIRHVTARTANANPTLTIYVFAHSNKAKLEIEENLRKIDFKNNNLKLIAPPLKSKEDISSDDYKFNLQVFNEMVFEGLLLPDDKQSITINIKDGKVSDDK